MSQKMVIEAKRKEMARFKRMKVYRVVTRESMKRDGSRKFQLKSRMVACPLVVNGVELVLSQLH